MILVLSPKYKREAKKRELECIDYIKKVLYDKKPTKYSEIILVPQYPWYISISNKQTVSINGKIVGHCRSNSYNKNLIKKMHSKSCLDKRRDSVGFPVEMEFFNGDVVRYVSILDAHKCTGVPMSNIRRWCFKDTNINERNSSAKKYGIIRCDFCD